MNNQLVDIDFKETFKQVSYQRRDKLIEELTEIFDLPAYHFSRSVLYRFYHLYPALYFDPAYATNLLQAIFSQGCFSVVDIDQGFYFKSIKFPSKNQPDTTRNSDAATIQKISDVNWLAFLDGIQKNYWSDPSTIDRFLSLSAFDMYEDREPKTRREKLVSTLIQATLNGQTSSIHRKMFTIELTVKYYESLIHHFLPDFSFQKKVSSSKIRRYAKPINEHWFLGIYIDFGFLLAELKKGYLEFPRMEIEVYDKSLKKCVRRSLYLVDQQDLPIVGLSLFYFMGNLVTDRIGNSSTDEESLKKKLFFSFEVYSFYLKKYLKRVEENLHLIQ